MNTISMSGFEIIIDFEKPIYSRPDGTFVATVNGYPYHVTENTPAAWAEVSAYLLLHPEALIPEPVPPEPTAEELAAREVAEARSYLASTDWIIAKIGEAQMMGQQIDGLLEKYASELAQRQEARLKA